MNQASDPVDIIWGNMGGTRGLYLFRKFIFNIIGLALVLFLSTPAAIYSSLKVLDAFKFLDVEYVAQGSMVGAFLRAFVPPLVVILLNNVLLYMIDYAAQWEKHTTHSNY